MTDYNRGDVVLVRTRLEGREEPTLRPALVVSSETYHQGRESQLVVAAITSNPRRILPGDTVLQRWGEAGLVGPSVATGVLLTLAGGSVERRLGALAAEDLRAVDASLRLALGM